jgi:ribosome biogenesis GTPase / thiamine phosphate phosphatase
MSTPGLLVKKGLVTGDFGRDFLVELPDRTALTCSRKGKKQDVTCGDHVEVTPNPDGREKTGRIETVLPRRNVLFRKDAWREKTLAQFQRHVYQSLFDRVRCGRYRADHHAE